MTREEFLDRARSLLPALRERAAETEKQRRVPQETIDDFVRLGLFRGLQPARWGGLEVEPSTFYEAVAEVASACVSSGWVLGVVGVHETPGARRIGHDANEIVQAGGEGQEVRPMKVGVHIGTPL